MITHDPTRRTPLSSREQSGESTSASGGRDGAESVYHHLRRAILRNELVTGNHFSQRELETRFRVGRTPLREALRMLQRDGLVEAEPNRRVRVAGVSFPDFEQLYAMRISLESLAIRVSVPQLQRDDLERLEGFVAQPADLSAPDAYERWRLAHDAFHHGLIAYAGARIVNTAAQLSDHAERYRHFYSTETPHAIERGISEHRAILDACLARDAELAAERLARHYASVVLGTLAVLAPEYDPALLRAALRAQLLTSGK